MVHPLLTHSEEIRGSLELHLHGKAKEFLDVCYSRWITSVLYGIM